MPWNNQSGGGGPWGGGGNNRRTVGAGTTRTERPAGLPSRSRRHHPPRPGPAEARAAGWRRRQPGLLRADRARLAGALGCSRRSTPCSPTRSRSSCASASRRHELSEPGLHFHWWPVETVEIANISEKLVNIGGGSRDPGNSGLMLSGDQNIVDVQFSVAYQVSDPKAYLFNVADPDDMVRQVAESAMREAVGRRPAQDIFRDDRQGIAESVREIIQTTLDELQGRPHRQRHLDRGCRAAARGGRRVRRSAARRAGRGQFRRGGQPVFQPEARPGARRGRAGPRRGGGLQEPGGAGSRG